MKKCPRVQNPCKICLQSVSNKNGIQCKGACKRWAHFTCLNYTPGKIQDIKAGIITITCPCPTCNTVEPKEYLNHPPYLCDNSGCPATSIPKCEKPSCPLNTSNPIPAYARPDSNNTGKQKPPCPPLPLDCFPKPHHAEPPACLPKPPACLPKPPCPATPPPGPRPEISPPVTYPPESTPGSPKPSHPLKSPVPPRSPKLPDKSCPPKATLSGTSAEALDCEPQCESPADNRVHIFKTGKKPEIKTTTDTARIRRHKKREEICSSESPATHKTEGKDRNYNSGCRSLSCSCISTPSQMSSLNQEDCVAPTECQKSCSESTLSKESHRVLLHTIHQLCSTVGHLSNQVKELMCKMLTTMNTD